MPMRKRERFERTDVPTYGPHTNAIALGVLVVVGVFLVALLSTLWQKANDAASLKDADLIASLGAQTDAASPADGYVASGNKFTNVLVLTVDDVSSSSSVLQTAQMLSLDSTTGTGSLVTFPLDTKLNDGTSDTTLAALYAQSGNSALINPLATATNVTISHVLVATDGIWGKLEGMKSSGVSALVGSASDVLSSVKTDMSTSEMLSLVEFVQSIGLDNLSRVDAPVTQEEDGNGGTRSVVDQTQLGLTLGTLVAAE